MNIYIYGDESGVFDKAHHETYVFGGLIFLDRQTRDAAYRQFIHAENRICENYPKDAELKASILSNKHRFGLFRCMNTYFRYMLKIHERRAYPEIFSYKKSKQRYLDYVFKVGMKNCLK